MGRHIVGTLICVGQIRHFRVGCRWHQTVKEVLHIGLHFWVGIFLNQQGGRGVLHQQRQQPVASDPIGNLSGEFIKAGAGGGDGEGSLHDKAA